MPWHMYKLNMIKKNPFHQKLSYFFYFLDPETDIVGQCLAPRTYIMGKRYYNDMKNGQNKPYYEQMDNFK